MHDLLIQDNFFPIVIQRQIHAFINTSNINWYYTTKNLSHSDNNIIENAKNRDTRICEEVSAFQHLFYPANTDITYKIDIKSLFQTYIEKNFNLKTKKIHRILANFYIPSPNFVEHNYMLPHIDQEEPHLTLIYYVNNCEGETYLFNELYRQNEEVTHYNKTLGKTIMPKQGRAILFNGFRYHAGSPSRHTVRQVININFET